MLYSIIIKVVQVSLMNSEMFSDLIKLYYKIIF